MDVDRTLSVPGGPVSDWPLALVAMVGGIGGAVIGVTFAADAGAAFPLTWGTLGTMLGNALCVPVWCVIEDQLAVRADESCTAPSPIRRV